MPPSAFDPTLYLDHTLLDRYAVSSRVVQLCEEAIQYRFPRICVYPVHVRSVVERVHRQSIRVVTVIGFPTGASTSAAKQFESEEALDQGAEELDISLNLGWLKEGNAEGIYQELAAIRAIAGDTLLKAILEVGALTPEEVQLAVEVCADVGIAYLKTGTGLLGAVSVEQVALLQSLAKGTMGIKAAGGIRSVEQAWSLVEAGATRLGTSYGVQLIEELKESAAP